MAGGAPCSWGCRRFSRTLWQRAGAHGGGVTSLIVPAVAPALLFPGAVGGGLVHSCLLCDRAYASPTAAVRLPVALRFAETPPAVLRATPSRERALRRPEPARPAGRTVGEALPGTSGRQEGEASSLSAAAKERARGLAAQLRRALPYLQARRRRPHLPSSPRPPSVPLRLSAALRSIHVKRIRPRTAEPQAAAGPLLRLNMALFYLHGVFYHPAFRVLGVRYIFIGKMLEVRNPGHSATAFDRSSDSVQLSVLTFL